METLTIKNETKMQINKIAAKLIEEGITPYSFTKEKAKNVTRNITNPSYFHKMIDLHPVNIILQIRRMSPQF